MKESKYYDLNTVAAYYSISEYLGEFVAMTFEKDLSKDEYERVIKSTLEECGFKNVDMKKLQKSFNHYMSDGEELTSQPAYLLETPDFEKHFK